MFAAAALFTVLLIVVLIPAIEQLAGQIAQQLPVWIEQVSTTFHLSIGESSAQASAEEFNQQLSAWVQDSGFSLLGLAGSAVSLIFPFFTIAMFAFHFAADAPQIRRAFLTRFQPSTSSGSAGPRTPRWNRPAATSTRGYFDPRLLLVFISGGLFFVVMLAVGVDLTIALPMSVFEGFVAEFIPTVGTYIGAAVPIIVTLGLVGVVPALILLGRTLISQQVENDVLSPKISSKTMELNGGVAFAAAMAGGAVAGPMGAFISLPIAAMITSHLRNSSRRQPLAYRSHYDPILADTVEEPPPQEAPERGAETPPEPARPQTD
ncbi:MAG TPA: AI-2E family transporter [Actinomycetes bacterium]